MKHFFSLASVIIIFTLHTIAQWSNDPHINNAICTKEYPQSFPTIVSDGVGGAIIAWMDKRSGVDYDVYAQRVSATGILKWQTDGVPISTAAIDQSNPRIVSDGVGGGIIAWWDTRSGTNYDIYVQRVDSAGVVRWETNGVPICLAANGTQPLGIVSDGAGGAIITWEDFRNTGNYDIYAQRINSLGVLQWDTNGIAVSTAKKNQRSPTIVSDAVGGAIITWSDSRNDSITGQDIYAQRVNATGVIQWTANGLAVCSAPSIQGFPTITSDAASGAVITWSDYRSGVDADIYAQRIDSGGVLKWITDGVLISSEQNNQLYPTISDDGNGGAFITWSDYRSGTNRDIYLQHVNATGIAWTGNGLPICTAPNGGPTYTIVSDDSGGAIITWHDYRSVMNGDVYAQRIDASGSIKWTIDGVPISQATNDQMYPVIEHNVKSGAIITWTDFRNGASDIYAQRLNDNGTLGVTTNISYRSDTKLLEKFSLEQNYPNPFNPTTLIKYDLPKQSHVTLSVYDIIGQRVAMLADEMQDTGYREVTFDGSKFSSGVYFYRLQAGSFIETKKLLLMK